MGAFEDAQRKNIDKQLKSGNITQSKADEARAKLGAASPAPKPSPTPSVGSNNIKKTDQGYAYNDKYGLSHVVSGYDIAKQYSGTGDVYDYTGKYGGGYALDAGGNRMAVNTPGVKPYGNDIRDGITTKFTSAGLGSVAAPTIKNQGQSVLTALNGQTAQQITPQTAMPTATAVANQPSMDWQQRLQWVQSNSNSAEVQQWANNEIARAGQVWQQKTAMGDAAGAEAAHQWANQLRSAMGLQAGVNYNQETGAAIGPAIGTTQTQPTQEATPWWENFAQETAPYENVPYQTDVQDILGELRKQVETPFSYDPQTDPQYEVLVNSATQTVMENMNARGILNSTVTRDQVAQAVAPIVSQLMQQAYTRYQGNISNIAGLLENVSGLESQQYERQKYAEETAYNRQRQAELDRLATEKAKLEQEQALLDNAWVRVKNLGYVDNSASVVLGVPVGTLSYEAQKAYEERQSKLQIAREQNAAAMARTQYTQGQISGRQQNTGSKIYQQAIALAQKDPRWESASSANERNAIILEYKDMLSGNIDNGSSQESTGPTDVDLFNDAMPKYIAAINSGEATLEEVYSEIDGLMTSGEITNSLGEIMKAQLNERF